MKTSPSHFTKTITNYQKADWTSLKQHVENLISHIPNPTNIYVANKSCQNNSAFDKLFIYKENQNSTNCTHLPMNICKLIQHRIHICNQNRAILQITAHKQTKT